MKNKMPIFPFNGITIIDRKLHKYEIYLIQSIQEFLGFELINETGEHLFIEVDFGPSPTQIRKIIIRK